MHFRLLILALHFCSRWKLSQPSLFWPSFPSFTWPQSPRFFQANRLLLCHWTSDWPICTLSRYRWKACVCYSYATNWPPMIWTPKGYSSSRVLCCFVLGAASLMAVKCLQFTNVRSSSDSLHQWLPNWDSTHEGGRSVSGKQKQKSLDHIKILDQNWHAITSAHIPWVRAQHQEVIGEPCKGLGEREL